MTAAAFQHPQSDPMRQRKMQAFQKQFATAVDNVTEVIKGKREVIEKTLLAMTAGGHVMLKDLPGVGKTMLARSIAGTIQCSFKRIQFTPDLLPMDITGTNVFNLRTKAFEFQPGPVFANILLADELNRATPKTQSALLEVMAERQVTVEGTTHAVAAPFLVIATMNPLDHEGTYALPAAQLDRFMVELNMGFPGPEAEIQMLDVHLSYDEPIRRLRPVVEQADFLAWQQIVPEIFFAETVKSYLVELMNEIRGDSRVLAPPSPRASLMLARIAQAHALTRGRDFVTPHDVQALAAEVLAHRLVISGDVSGHAYVAEILSGVPVWE